MSTVIRLKGVTINNPLLPKVPYEYNFSGLAALYRCSEPVVAGKVVDSSGNNAHGTGFGGTLDAEGLSFNSHEFNTGLKLAHDEHTIFAVFKISAPAGSFQYPISGWQESSMIYRRNTGELALYAAYRDLTTQATGSMAVDVAQAESVSDKWIFAALSASPSGNRFYAPQFGVNSLVPLPANKVVKGNTNQTVRVGRDASLSQASLIGKIGTVGIYNRALSSDELSDLYQVARRQMLLRGVTI